MKKWIATLLCVCILSVTASASDNTPDFLAEYVALFGEAPAAANFSSDEDYQASYAVWLSALENYVFLRSEAYEQQKAEEAARLAAEQEAAQKAAEVEQAAAPPESAESAFSNNEAAESEEITALPESIESAGTNHETDSSVSVSPSPVNQYPDRVRVDLAGNIWSLDGELLSPGTTPAMEPASVPDDESADPDNLSAVADPDTLAVIAGLVSDIATDPPAWYVEDFRPVDPPVEVLTGLKSMVTSIFGEYTPVTTTSVISETVGNDTYQYLVETVAPGAAGVDYEWVAGVLLFAILLYCFMKLLGGVLK